MPREPQMTQEGVAEALDDLDKWVSDQLSLGILKFLDVIDENCRHIADRLIDRKVTALASRIDGIPKRILAVEPEQRPQAVIREFGKLVALVRAWRDDPDSQFLNRYVTTYPSQEDVLKDPDALRLTGRWEYLGETALAGHDDMATHASWFLSITPQTTPWLLEQSSEEPGDPAFPQFALIVYPAVMEREESPYTVGIQYEGTMVFYPGPLPLEAVVETLSVARGERPWPQRIFDDPLTQILPYTQALPWAQNYPLLLPRGRFIEMIRSADSGTWMDYWWISDTGAGLPCRARLIINRSLLADAMVPHQTVGIWDGYYLTLLESQTAHGRIKYSLDDDGNLAIS
ncbi:MAG: hypothetical protein FWG15_01650 [Propionibacteriaceae bacterium]|nr:hypothetical protein [Propionibacteriaceae bacterium]